jgi:hypothetical protein
MSSRRRAQLWHAITFLVAAGAVILQLRLVISAQRVTLGGAEGVTPDLLTRLIRFASFMTIWFNVMVAGTCAVLMVDPQHDGRIFRAVRLDGVVIALVGAVVHWFLLRPLLHLQGLDYLADKLLHIVVPLLALSGWLMFGPRHRVDPRDVGAFLVIPLVWLTYTLTRGAMVHWYPYPFLNVDRHGYGFVSAMSGALAAALLGVAMAAMWLDRRLSATLPAVRSQKG